MLPDKAICVRHIAEFQKRVAKSERKAEYETYGLLPFWNWKQAVEKAGQSVLDQNNMAEAAKRIRKFLIAWGIERTGIAKPPAIADLLKNIAPKHLPK